MQTTMKIEGLKSLRISEAVMALVESGAKLRDCAKSYAIDPREQNEKALERAARVFAAWTDAMAYLRAKEKKASNASLK
jgi:hypothetical protein